MSSVIQLVLDIVFTPCVLRQQHRMKAILPPVTCVIMMMKEKEKEKEKLRRQ
jgi:hypothetical protein